MEKKPFPTKDNFCVSLMFQRVGYGTIIYSFFSRKDTDSVLHFLVCGSLVFLRYFSFHLSENIEIGSAKFLWTGIGLKFWFLFSCCCCFILTFGKLSCLVIHLEIHPSRCWSHTTKLNLSCLTRTDWEAWPLTP